ncbi:MAG: Amidase, partial [Devosia sp.]|nr:Amidase [Devosia sp.]
MPHPNTKLFLPAQSWIGRPLPELAQALAEGSVSSEELTKAYLARIAEHDRACCAFIHVTAEFALAQARNCDAALADGRVLGPLHG